MSIIHPGDDDMHHCDSSHRWTAPPGIDQRTWSAQVRKHMQVHLALTGGDAGTDDAQEVLAHIPAPRRRRPDALVVGRKMGERVGG